MSPSGCHGHQRSTSLMDGQVAPLGLQVFPQETPTVEQAVLGMHVWVRGSEWVMMAESRIVLGVRLMTRKAASSQR